MYFLDISIILQKTTEKNPGLFCRESNLKGIFYMSKACMIWHLAFWGLNWEVSFLCVLAFPAVEKHFFEIFVCLPPKYWATLIHLIFQGGFIFLKHKCLLQKLFIIHSWSQVWKSKPAQHSQMIPPINC